MKSSVRSTGVSVFRLADHRQNLLSAARILPRNQPNPGRHLATVLQFTGISPARALATTIAQHEFEMAVERLNKHPGKRLGYRTPNQVFFNPSGVALKIEPAYR